MMKLRLIFGLVLLNSTWVVSGPIEDTFGAGARNKGLAGAGVTVAEDFTATFYNPSMLGLCRGSRLSAGYDFVHTGLNASSPAQQLGDYNSMSMGFCLKPLNQLGIGLYSNFSMGPIEFAPSTVTPEPNFILYGGDLKAFSMMLGAGYAPFHWLSLGLAASMATGVNLAANMNFQYPAPQNTPSMIASFPAQIKPIMGVIAGITGVPLHNWKLAMIYRSELYGKVDIDMTARLNQTDPTDKPAVDATIQGFLSYSPHQIALGSSYFLKDTWLFSADLTYYFWSKYQGPFLQAKTTDRSSVAPGVTILGVEDPHFSDIIVPRVGVEYGIYDKLKLRVGYSFRPTPAPYPPGQAQLLDASAHRVSMGAGYEFQLYQNIFLTADTFLAADILMEGRGTALNTGLLIGAEYD